MIENTSGPVADDELRLEWWEGEGEHAPGVLFEESSNKGMLTGDVVLLDIAAWVALTALSGVIGNTAFEAIKTKVRGVLTAKRRQEGRAYLNELKRLVFEEMSKHRSNGKLTEEQLRERIDAFFDEIQG